MSELGCINTSDLKIRLDWWQVWSFTNVPLSHPAKAPLDVSRRWSWSSLTTTALRWRGTLSRVPKTRVSNPGLSDSLQERLLPHHLNPLSPLAPVLPPL